MKITAATPADRGLLKALALKVIPKGVAKEFGCGTGRNFLATAAAGFPSVGYDVNPLYVDLARESIAARKLGSSANAYLSDVRQMDFAPNSISIAMVGTPIFWKKSAVYAFFVKLWPAIKRKGILHVEFATPEDGSYASDFFIMTCSFLPEVGYSHSYGHECGYNCAENHPGCSGASFWQPKEIHEFISKLGRHTVIYNKLYQWMQTTTDYPPQISRSFYRITIQKS